MAVSIWQTFVTSQRLDVDIDSEEHALKYIYCVESRPSEIIAHNKEGCFSAFQSEISQEQS